MFLSTYCMALVVDVSECAAVFSYYIGVYSSIPDQVKVNTVATAASGGAGFDESYYATPKSTMEQVLYSMLYMS